MNHNSQLQKLFDKIKTLDGIGIDSVLKECRDINGVIDNKTALMTVASSNWNRNGKNGLSKLKYIVKVLIEHRADVNFKNSGGYTALHFVVSGLKEVTDLEIVQLLLDNGADPNVVDNFGKPPIFYCKDKWMERMIQMFQIHGANIREKENGGNTVLHRTWSTVTLRELLKLDVDVNVRIKDNGGNTFLHRTWSTITLRELFKFNVDVNAQNNHGEGEIYNQIGYYYGLGDSAEDSSIELLIQNNANVNTKELHGLTPLFLACGLKNKNVSGKLAKIYYY